MGKTRPSYPPEFKEEAVRLVRVVSEARWPVPKRWLASSASPRRRSGVG
jgi:hypothetical protein